MFEEISNAMKYGLFQQAGQIGRDWGNHFQAKQARKEQDILNNYVLTYNSIMDNFNKEFEVRNNSFNIVKRDNEDITFNSKKMDNNYANLKKDYNNLVQKYNTASSVKTDRLQDKDESIKKRMAIIDALNESINNMRQQQLEIARKSAIYYRDLSGLELDVFYMRAATIADGAVRNFLNEIIQKKIHIDDLDGHEINVFAMAYEAYVKMNDMTSDPQWKTRMNIAIEDRKE